jgi:hypothetical protein
MASNGTPGVATRLARPSFCGIDSPEDKGGRIPTGVNGMAFDERRFERFAMKLEEMSQGATPAKDGLAIDEVSNALGLSLEDGRELAQWLHDTGWAIQTSSGPKPRLRLTFKGYREIALLRRPPLRRWVDQHPITMNVFWMPATSIVAGIIYTVMTFYLLKGR